MPSIAALTSRITIGSLHPAKRWNVAEISMGESTFQIPPVEKPLSKRLDSWKEIAVYLNRDVTTVQRWEKREGMPVHRHLHDKRGSVYALTEELDDWIQSRRSPVDEPEVSADAEIPPAAPSARGAVPERNSRQWIALAVVLCLCIPAAWFVLRRPSVAPEPRIRSLAVLPLRNLSG